MKQRQTYEKQYAEGFDAGTIFGYGCGLWDGYAKGLDDATATMMEVIRE
jgi:hypothetical protein